MRRAAPATLACILACGGDAPPPPVSTPRQIPVVASASAGHARLPVPAQTAAPRVPERRVLVRGARFDNPTAMAVDDRNVYVSSAGHVLAVGKDGGGDPQPLLPQGTIADAFLVEGGHLYASAQVSDHVGKSMGGILRVDTATREVTVLAKHKMPGAIAMDDASIWYGALDEKAWRIPRAGGKPVGVAGVFGTVHAIEVDAKNVYFATTRYGLKQTSTIYVASRSGGPATVLAEKLVDAMALTLVGDDLFVVDNGRVGVRNLVSGVSTPVSARGSAIRLARNDRGVFWCAIDFQGAAAHVGTFDLAKREVGVLSTEPAPVGVTADAGAVYWADAQTREVVSLALSR